MPPDLTPGLNVKISQFNSLDILTGNENLLVEKDKYEARTNYDKLVKLPISLISVNNTEKIDVTIDGPSVGIGGVPIGFLISNYDSYMEYTIVPLAGTIYVDPLNKQIIVYTPPFINGVSGFTVNGKLIEIDISTVIITTPSITSPLNNATITDNFLTYTSSPFATTGGSDAHFSSDWEIATDIAFNTIIDSSINSTTNKTTKNITALAESTSYYARVKYRSVSGKISEWSPTIKITTSSFVHVYSESVTSITRDPADNNDPDKFGISIAITDSGDRIAVGSTFADVAGAEYEDSGQVHIYLKVNGVWTQEQILVNSDRFGFEEFGNDVAFDSTGTRIVIGSYMNGGNTSSSETGAAYVFSRSGTTWTQEAKLLGSDEEMFYYFGSTVNIDSTGSRIAIGAPFKTVNTEPNVGGVYIFRRSGTTWVEEQILTPSDPTFNSYFGNSISFDSTASRIIIGSYNVSIQPMSACGAAYVFSRSGNLWVEEQVLTASDKDHIDFFGVSVDINSDGSIAIIGARGKNIGVNDVGVAYIFTRTAAIWSEVQRLNASVVGAGHNFGYSVAINNNGNIILVAAPWRNPNLITAAGSIYVFNKSGSTWVESQILSITNKTANDNIGLTLATNSNFDTILSSVPKKLPLSKVFIFY